MMNRKIIKLAAILFSMIMLAGCTRNLDDQRVAVSVIGPNDMPQACFYRIVKDADSYPFGAIARMDVDTASDTIVYEPENSRYIYTSVECGDGVLVALTRTQEIRKFTLVYIDGNAEARTVYESDYEMQIKNVDGRIFILDNYSDKYLFDPESCEVTQVETDEIEYDALTAAYDAVSGMYHTMQDGTRVTLRKTFGEDSFTCEANGTEIPLNCISGEEYKYAQWGNISDNNGILYGVTAVPVYKSDQRRMEVGLGLLSLDDITKELLFAVDVAGGNSEVIFETDDARIIGYADQVVYLYRDSTVYKRDLSSGKEEALGKISAASDDYLEFCWMGKKLFVLKAHSGAFITTIQG